MAEELDDGEFWLPSQFLTDDDILMDFSPPKSDLFGSGSGSGSSSDLGSLTGSTETEISDDDDLLLANLARQFTLQDGAADSKGWVLSSSPQSTLCGCVYNQEGSSLGSPTGAAEPVKSNENNETLDLLCKAAGEVAKMKMRSERSTGTGFFDCSNSAKGLLCPPPPPSLQPQPSLPRNPTRFPPFYCQPPQFHHFPPMMLGPVPFQQQNNRVTRNINNNNKNTDSSGNPLGLPPSAWPPLQPQTQPQTQAQAQAQAQPMAPGMFMGQPGPKRECVGTGVFLPRRVNTPAEPKKKSDGNATKAKTGKGAQRRNARPSSTTVNNDEIKLPQEWTY